MKTTSTTLLHSQSKLFHIQKLVPVQCCFTLTKGGIITHILKNKRGDRSLPNYTLLPFPIFQGHCFSFIYMHLMPLLVQCTFPKSYFSFQHRQMAPIEKLYSLHQLALVGDQNSMQILGLYCFVSEEFNYNVANYISSQIDDYSKKKPKYSIDYFFKYDLILIINQRIKR